MSRHRRQQLKRNRAWGIEVRETEFGWRASWWIRFARTALWSHMFDVNRFPKVEQLPNGVKL